MQQATEFVSLRVPRSAIPEIPGLANELVDRMHNLLERNTDGELTAIERQELETLVRMAQFAQILALISKEPPSRSARASGEYRERPAPHGRTWGVGRVQRRNPKCRSRPMLPT